ncbi:MAG: hypothetical protein AMS17_04845 [Spirochaetes bacterium DG_61]|nr:MAG: hypothetical protein AMS17_04845 [Spirochaetes bacterium DG_61]
MKKSLCLTIALILVFTLTAFTVFAGGKEKEKGPKLMKAEDITIGVSIFMAMPFTETIKKGAEHAAQDLGCKVEVVAPSAYDPDAQLAQFEGLVAKGVQGILLQPVPEDYFTVPINNAIDGGIPVMTFDATPFDSKAVVYFGPSGSRSGEKLGKLALQKLTDAGITRGKVIMSICFPGVYQLEARVRSFQKAFQGTSFDILGPFDCGEEQADVYAFWESTYAGHPDMLLAVGACAQDLPNIYKFKLKSGADFHAIGYDEELESLRAIKEGYADATVGEHPYLYGYLGVKAMFEHFKDGKPLPQGWIYCGGEIVTKDNVDVIYERESDFDKMHEWYLKYIEDNYADLNAVAEPLNNLEKLDVLGID